MNQSKVKIAAAEARRFLAKVKDYEATPSEYEYVGTKASGAVKRASMDLTRALAELRRPS